MNESQRLNHIIEAGEGQFIEFKESIDKDLPKELVAFANASGGGIYLGITDDGMMRGFCLTNKIRSDIQNMARNCDPSITIIIKEVDNIAVIEILEGKNKPYACSSGFFMRMGANSQKMRRDEIMALSIKSGRIRFDEQICAGFEWDDFDEEKLQHYLKLAKISDSLSRDELLMNLRVLTNEGLTNAGVLFFAKHPSKYIISSKLRCIHFADSERLSILDKKVIDKGILGNIEFAVEYIKERVPVRYEIKSLARKEYSEYPFNSYREAIVNAVVHFDYFLGDMIAVEKHSDMIIVNNKGELLFPKKDFGKKSEARNRLLSDLLSRTEYMEKAGTGIKRMRTACESNGNAISFYFSDSFWVQIHSNNDKNVTDDVTDDVTDRSVKIVKLIKSNSEISTLRMAKALSVSKRTILRDIELLKRKGIIEREGSEKNGKWKLINPEDD